MKTLGVITAATVLVAGLAVFFVQPRTEAGIAFLVAICAAVVVLVGSVVAIVNRARNRDDAGGGKKKRKRKK